MGRIRRKITYTIASYAYLDDDDGETIKAAESIVGRIRSQRTAERIIERKVGRPVIITNVSTVTEVREMTAEDFITHSQLVDTFED